MSNKELAKHLLDIAQDQPRRTRVPDATLLQMAARRLDIPEDPEQPALSEEVATMPESFIPVWMSLGEAEEFRRFLQEEARSTDGEFPEREFELINTALEEERPRSFEELQAERHQPDLRSNPFLRGLDSVLGPIYMEDDAPCLDDYRRAVEAGLVALSEGDEPWAPPSGPACTCGHKATDHRRPDCMVNGCGCELYEAALSEGVGSDRTEQLLAWIDRVEAFRDVSPEALEELSRLREGVGSGAGPQPSSVAAVEDSSPSARASAAPSVYDFSELDALSRAAVEIDHLNEAGSKEWAELLLGLEADGWQLVRSAPSHLECICTAADDPNDHRKDCPCWGAPAPLVYTAGGDVVRSGSGEKQCCRGMLLLDVEHGQNLQPCPRCSRCQPEKGGEG